MTFNVKDFPANGYEVFDLEVIQPDDFLLDALDLRPPKVLAALDRQVTHYRRPPTTIAGLMDALARCGVPGFADEIRRRIG